jgi:peroxiredoxin Q/BCP
LTSRIEVGYTAPDFALRSQTGELVNLKDVLGKREVVLYFYPRDFTPGCTVEARTFRDHYEAFKDIGAEVIGVSSDSVESHRDFASKCELPFTVLSDDGGKVRRLYGVPSSMGLVPGRVTYVIDTDGVVRHIFNSQLNPGKHVEEAMKVLKGIRSERAGSVRS